jgi:arylsulfatase
VAAAVYDVQRDPREESPMTEIALWASASYQDIIARHKMTIAKYPHAKVGRDRPYSGIDNVRLKARIW